MSFFSNLVRTRAGGAFAVVMTVMLAMFAADADGKRKKKAAAVETIEDLQVVTCLLPGQVRQLGRRANFVGKRRPIMTTAIDCEIRGGEYTAYDRGSYDAALDAWLPDARVGDAKAQTYVGEIYEKGLTGEPDYDLAAVWYKKAAEQGFNRAQVNLAHLYETGQGVERDPEAALSWYRKAAGITEAMVLDSRQEAEELRRELDRVTAEAATVQGDLEESTRQLEAARSEIETTRGEIERLRRKLEQARRAGTASAAEAERLAAEVARQEAELARKTEVVTKQVADVESQQAKLKSFRERVEQARSEAGSLGRPTVAAGPKIEILRPDVLSTRGPAIVRLPAGASEVEIAGRVTASAGIDRLSVDEEAFTPDAKGYFKAKIPRAGDRQEVRIEARDKEGRVAQRTLSLEQGSEPGMSAAEPLPASDSVPAVGTGSYTALIVSVSNYSHFPALETARADAEDIEQLLREKYGFQTKLLRDPTNLAFLNELKTLSERLGPEDNLLVYYAGHGKIEPEKRRGYWIPYDAGSDETGKWIPNDTISAYLELFKAKHVMVISDSCYSGTMTLSGVPHPAADLPAEKLGSIAEKRSRTVLTSGGLQPVLDAGGGEHSIFAQALLTVLKLNRQALPGVSLHQEIAARVTYAASELGFDQIPQYAPVRFAGHEAGDFVLVPTRAKSAAGRPGAS